MALVLADRVRETTNTSGTSDILLAGPVIGFQDFSVVGDGNTTYYCLAGQATNEWEVGIGTFVASTNTLQRTTVLANSAGNAPSKINFASGTKDIFVTYPEDRSVYRAVNGNVDGFVFTDSGLTVGSGKTLDVSAGTFVVANDQISGDAINGGTATPTTLTATTVNATTVDINGGAIDGVTLGTNSPVTNAQIDNININGNTVSSTDTNGNIIFDPNGTGAVQEVVGSTAFNIVSQTDIGTAPNEIPLNQYLGNLAYQDAGSIAGNVVVGGTVTSAGVSSTAPSVISVNSSSDALRITQTGSGNCLVVEDSANPDATPTVITANGRVVVGYTDAITGPGGNTSALQTHSTSVFQMGFAGTYWAADGNGASAYLAKSRGSSIGTRGIVSDGDETGRIIFAGDDGTNFINTAWIRSQVDGTPGTNDMPGRLVFFTTADGASSPTERMRIGSTGAVAIGSTVTGGGGSGCSIRFANDLTGSIAPVSILGTPTIKSDATGTAVIFASIPSTEAASFTCDAINHYRATQGTIGSGSTVTNQYGFLANSNLTGATNNFGFYSNIASGTGRWNFYAAGSAANYFAGTVSIQTTSSDLAGNGTPYNIGSDGQNVKYSLVSFNSTTGNATHCVFRNGNGIVGTISTNASATTYATSSDYRLKDNITDAPSASDLIDAIRIRSFDWKTDGSHQKYGVVAQELDPIAPEAVSKGKKEDDMWSVDYSKLVPMLVKEVQTLRSRVQQLEGN